MNFALIMFLLLVVTGGVWLLDHYVLRRQIKHIEAPNDAGGDRQDEQDQGEIAQERLQIH